MNDKIELITEFINVNIERDMTALKNCKDETHAAVLAGRIQMLFELRSLLYE